ncbi:MAG: hypothetical protein MUF75_10000 [Bacteroidia bacterium]|nr:hypothetical protein [Bacteroidia bacterium]
MNKDEPFEPNETLLNNLELFKRRVVLYVLHLRLKMIPRFKYVFSLVVFLLLMLYPIDFSAQCAMCKEAAESSLKNDPKSMARSLNSGILYLMAVPYLMILFIFRKQIVNLWKSKFGKVKTQDVDA